MKKQLIGATVASIMVIGTIGAVGSITNNNLNNSTQLLSVNTTNREGTSATATDATTDVVLTTQLLLTSTDPSLGWNDGNTITIMDAAADTEVAKATFTYDEDNLENVPVTEAEKGKGSTFSTATFDIDDSNALERGKTYSIAGLELSEFTVGERTPDPTSAYHFDVWKIASVNNGTENVTINWSFYFSDNAIDELIIASGEDAIDADVILDTFVFDEFNYVFTNIDDENDTIVGSITSVDFTIIENHDDNGFGIYFATQITSDTTGSYKLTSKQTITTIGDTQVVSYPGQSYLTDPNFNIIASSDDGLSGGAIAGIVIGSLAVVGLIAGGGYYFHTTKNTTEKSAKNTTEKSAKNTTEKSAKNTTEKSAKNTTEKSAKKTTTKQKK